MSDEIDDGGNAFPSMLPGGHYQTTGMSLRDWFAGQVLSSSWEGRFPHDIVPPTSQRIAEACYEIADAMLRAREAKQ